jgi:hypothetical protein
MKIYNHLLDRDFTNTNPYTHGGRIRHLPPSPPSGLLAEIKIEKE